MAKARRLFFCQTSLVKIQCFSCETNLEMRQTVSTLTREFSCYVQLHVGFQNALELHIFTEDTLFFQLQSEGFSMCVFCEKNVEAPAFLVSRRLLGKSDLLIWSLTLRFILVLKKHRKKLESINYVNLIAMKNILDRFFAVRYWKSTFSNIWTSSVNFSFYSFVLKTRPRKTLGLPWHRKTSR